MKISIYTLFKKCFGFSLAIFLFLNLTFFQSCKTNKVEIASDRVLIEADTAKINGWELVPAKTDKEDAYKVMRKNGSWLVSVVGNEPSLPDTSYIRRSLKHLNNFIASAELNIPEKNWDTLGVTDNDTRLIIYEDGKKEQEIILGKLFFNSENKSAYYVRLKGENKVYKLPLYLDGSLKVPAEKLRKKDMVGLAAEQIAEIMFLQPSGIDFVLKRAGQHAWSINSILTNDSLSEKYVQYLSKFQINKFGNVPTTGAVMSIQITSYSGKQISIRAYKKSSDTWIISSSENLGNYVELDQKTFAQLFPGKEYFTQPGGKK